MQTDIFIGLNIVRILSLVALILVVASNILVLVNDVKAVNHFEAEGQENNGSNSTATMTDDYIRYENRIYGSVIFDIDGHSSFYSGSTVPNQQAGAFWAVLNRLLIIGQVMVLFLSELGFPMRFFDRYFPVLGKTFGLGALGVIQMLSVLHDLRLYKVLTENPLQNWCSYSLTSRRYLHSRFRILSFLNRLSECFSWSNLPRKSQVQAFHHVVARTHEECSSHSSPTRPRSRKNTLFTLAVGEEKICAVQRLVQEAELRKWWWPEAKFFRDGFR